MKLTIFGATGSTGRHLVQQALRAGHEVTAFTRTPGGLPIQHPGLRIAVGTLDQDAAMRDAVRGADAVISVLGLRNNEAGAVCTDGARGILKAMGATGARRLIALSAYGASETRRDSLFIRFVRKVIAQKMRDKDNMEELVRGSGTDWTLVRPPALTDGKATNSYRAGTGLKPGMTGRLSRADLAAFILQEAAEGAYIRKAPLVMQA